MEKYRIIQKTGIFKPQRKYFLIGWRTLQEYGIKEIIGTDIICRSVESAKVQIERDKKGISKITEKVVYSE